MLLSFLVATYVALAPANSTYPQVLSCIATYESGVNQFTPSGAPLWSPTKDVGIMQIHYTWLPTAENMGLDIVNNPKDNVEFGIWLYNKYGPSPWTTYKRYCSGNLDG